MKKVLLFLLSLYCFGCATAPTLKYSLKEVQFISEYPGAVIEIDGRYYGKTPITIKMYGSDTPVDYPVYPVYTITASPTEPGHCQQKKRISAYNLPEIVYFNTALCPSADIKVDINE